MRRVNRVLAQLRLDAEASLRAEDWPALLGYAERLRSEDVEWWPHLWAPCVALAEHATDYARVVELDRELRAAEAELEQVEEQWLEASTVADG